MHRAVSEAISAGAHKVVIVGADCPDLDSALLTSAFDALRDRQVVFGPARDGGYYLVGSRQPSPFLFQDITWGARNLLATSVARAREGGIEFCLLRELSDVDEPTDLPVWENSRRTSRSVSVIIPTLNEAKHLPGTLQNLDASQPTEIIVADGGSRDDTPRIAEAHGARVVTCTPNRARQMNAGAATARGEALLFLHADTRLPSTACRDLLAAFRSPTIVGGAFRFAIADPFPGRWLIEITANLRSRLWWMPYGDQALFVRRWAFDELGGFPDLPIMEDYQFVRRLRDIGRLALLDAAVLTSGRRWQRLGCLRATLMNELVILGYHCGVSPARLAAFYHTRPAPLKPRHGTSKDLAQSIRTNELV